MTLSEARRTFADLMKQAREGQLSEHARKKLAQARQILRRSKRPAMNARKRYHKPYHSLEPQIFESMAYRGYLIKFNALRDEYFIEKDKAFIGYAQTIPEAKRKIDSIFGDNPSVLRFRDLSIGEKFEFDRTGVEFSGMASGPWIKTGPRTYRPAISDTELMEQLKRQYGSYATKGMLRNMTKIRVGSINAQVVRLNPKLTRRKARLILHEGKVRGRKLTGRQRRFFGARASGYPRKNPAGRIQNIGRALEVRYHRTVGRQRGYYKHEIKSRRAGVYTIPPGWVYVGENSILITEETPRV